MYSSVKRQLPDFIAQYLVYCDCFIDIYKQKTCLALTRNLKFFEFHQKQLLSSIDLGKTCLKKVQEAIKTYKGPKGNWFETSTDDSENGIVARSIDSLSTATTGNKGDATAMDICLGKYVFQSLNVMKVYIIIQCWDKCVILYRLPNFGGFEVRAEYENVQNIKITHGPLKYCPVLEVNLQGATIKTDFQETECERTSLEDFANKNMELKQLLGRARSAKAELQLHKGITAHSFQNLHNSLHYGRPGIGSVKLEEKQVLARCGDIWKRFTAQNDLIIGIPMVNQCGPPNLTILHNIRVLLQPNPCPENIINVEYRLFQLKLTFDQLDAVETFLQSEDENLQAKVWSSDKKRQLLPESFATLLVKFKITQIINLKQCPLLLSYDVHKEFNSQTTITSLQLFLQIIDFYDILHVNRPKYELSFQLELLQQDFLATAFASQEIWLKIIFESSNDVDSFENCLMQKYVLEKLPTNTEKEINHTIFYGSQRNSLWFGCLILRNAEIEDNEYGHSITTWKIFCPDSEKRILFIKVVLNDLIALHCNIVSIENYKKSLTDLQNVAELETALRLELDYLRELVNDIKPNNSFEKLFVNFCKTQTRSDILMKQIKENESNT